MAVDIAQLGMSIDSEGALLASKRLRDLEGASKKAETAAERLSRQAKKVSSSMKKLGQNMSLYVTAPLIGIAGIAVKTASDFESSFADIRKTVSATEKQFAEMANGMRELAKTVPTTVDELNRLGGVAGQLGVARENIVEFTRVIAMLGDTTDVAGEDAALSLSRFMNIMGTAQSDIDRVGSTIVGLGNNFAAMESEIINTATSLAGFGNQMGLTEAQVLAFATAIAASGGETEAASTAFQKTASTMQRAVIEMNADLKTFADIADISTDEFARAFRENAANAIQLFLAGLKNVSDQGLSTAAVLETLGLADQRLQREFGKLIGNLDQLDAALIQGSEEWEKNTALTEEAAKRYKTFASEMRMLRNQIRDVSIELGTALLPHIRAMRDDADGVVATLRGWVDAFKNADTETQKLVLRVLAFTAAIGPLLIVLGSIIKAIGVLIPLLGKLKILFGPVGIALGLLELVRLIGDAYINSITDAITGTKKFISTLNDLKAAGDLAGLARHLDAVNERIIDNLRRQKETQADISGTSGNTFLGRLRLDNFRADLEQLERELGHLRKLRQQYEFDINALTKTEIDPAVLQELTDNLKFLDELDKDVTVSVDTEALQELLDILDPTAKAMKDLAAARKLLNQAFKNNPTELARFNALLEKSALAMDALGDAALRLKQVSPQVAAELADSFKFLEDLGEIRDLDLTNFENLKRIIDPATAAMQDLADARALLQKVFDEQLIDLDQAEFDRLKEALEKSTLAGKQMAQVFAEATGLLAGAFGSLAQNLDEGSSAQRAFAIAAEVANAVLAIQAVLTQGGGDPYSAFARMAAMASIVAGLGFSVGSILGGGSASNASASQQAAQGAGSVLGDTQAKTESILKASEITADATSELVGINRGMLHALISLQAGIENAVIKLARGAGGDFGALPSTFQPGDLFKKLPVIGNILGGLFNKLFGGKSKLIDEGIRILGGTLDDVINETIVEAFRLVSVKKHIFASTKLREQFQSLGDEVADQFALIFESIRDTVTEAAIALGIPLDVIQARLDAFTIATQKISFKDLSAEEQREELLAVFGEIFDDLALAVIPFIDQFQAVGEGLGETLVRVATSVQVFQEAINALGLTVNETDPELFAQMAVGIAELTGGVENFISLFTTFFDKFASDEQKLAFATDQLTRAFADVGLEIPETRDGMIDLLRSLDATTEAGREQIATVLLLSSVADEYYDLIETAEEARLAQARELADAMAAAQAEQLRQAQLIADFVGTGPSSALIDLRNRFEDAMDAADALGASQREYAMILRSFDRQLQRMAAELTLRIMSLTEQLFGGEGLGGVTDSIQNDIEDVRTVSNALFTEWQNALSNLLEFTKSILLDEQLSPLTPAERLTEARQQFEELLSAALGGDVEAAQDLPKAAKALLDEARFVFASSDRFQEIFDSTLAALDRVKIPSNVKEFVTSGGGSSSAAEPTLDPVQQAFITALERLLLATDLAEALRDLSQVLDVSVIQLATELGVPLNQLVSLLGVELGRLTADTAGQLANAAELLGADVLELAAAIDIGLRDLAAASGVQLGEMTQALVAQLGQFAADLGINVLTLTDALNISIADLAATFGIGIENFEASQFKALVNFSDALGAGVREVADELKINLGDITDATSLLSQSLDMAIADLPVAIQADLGPLLDAIREATTAADANAAIFSLGTFIQSLPGDIGSELIAFLKLIGFQEQTPEVAALNAIVGNTSAAVSLLSRISNSLGGLGTVAKTISTIPAPVLTAVSAGISVGTLGSSGFPSFAHGGAIENTGLHQLHAGEFVVNPTASNLNVAVADSLSADELSQIRVVLEDIREQNRKYQDADLTIGKGIESGVKQQAEVARRKANG